KQSNQEHRFPHDHFPSPLTSTVPSEFVPALIFIFTRPRAQAGIGALPFTVTFERNLLLHTMNVCSPTGRFLIANLPSLSLIAKYGSSRISKCAFIHG